MSIQTACWHVEGTIDLIFCSQKEKVLFYFYFILKVLFCFSLKEFYRRGGRWGGRYHNQWDYHLKKRIFTLLKCFFFRNSNCMCDSKVIMDFVTGNVNRFVFIDLHKSVKILSKKKKKREKRKERYKTRAVNIWELLGMRNQNKTKNK